MREPLTRSNDRQRNSKTAQVYLQLAKQRYKLGLGMVVEVMQSEVAVTEAQYDCKIAEVTLAYSAGEDSRRMLKKAIQQSRSRRKHRRRRVGD